ncbi:hypothetical protein [Pseudomonas phage D6]|nr:hypothetical protein [Pseudomonas phage D6]
MVNEKYMYLLITYDNAVEQLEMPEAIAKLTIDQFLRPEKKVRSRKQDMKTV